MGYDERAAALEITRLGSELASARSELSEARDQIASLEQRLIESLAELEEERRKNARQAAPFRREEKKKIPTAQQKKPGRKPGHPGAYRKIPNTVDHEVEAPLPCCPHCQGEVTDRAPLVQWIEEIPPVRPVVTRLTTWQANCPRCGEVRSRAIRYKRPRPAARPLCSWGLGRYRSPRC